LPFLCDDLKRRQQKYEQIASFKFKVFSASLPQIGFDFAVHFASLRPSAAEPHSA
jgi:hypothetical protein